MMNILIVMAALVPVSALVGYAMGQSGGLGKVGTLRAMGKAWVSLCGVIGLFMVVAWLLMPRHGY